MTHTCSQCGAVKRTKRSMLQHLTDHWDYFDEQMMIVEGQRLELEQIIIKPNNK